MSYAVGSKALGICDRCGFSYKLLNDIINQFKSEETNLIRNFEINVDVVT